MIIWPSSFVIDVIEHLDLVPFYARYRRGEAGRAAYDPKMLLDSHFPLLGKSVRAGALKQATPARSVSYA